MRALVIAVVATLALLVLAGPAAAQELYPPTTDVGGGEETVVRSSGEAGGLASTGFDVDEGLLVAAGLIAAGAGAVGVARRRRTAR